MSLPRSNWLILLAVSLLLCGCDRPRIDRGSPSPGGLDALGGLDSSQAEAGGSGQCGDQPPAQVRTFETDPRVSSVLGTMTLTEKVEQMAGTQSLVEMFATPDNLKAGIRGLKFRDGPRGVRMESSTATCFPVAVARAAAWDLDLERRVGQAMGAETRGVGYNCLLAPTINTLRHPGWGRAQETYGEDPWLLGMMGIASVQGIQEFVPACAKHFAANNIEDTRMTNNALVEERNLRENYTRQFEMVIERADVACIMAAYNKLNGAYCCENQPLLRELLKGEWGFDGFVVSDWLATQSTVESALAGLDVEMPWRSFYDGLQLAVTSGQVPEEVIDEAVERILRIKFKFGFALLSESFEGDPSVVEGPEHIALAREAARKGMVLLKNQGGVLPLGRSAGQRIAVIGPWADQARLGDLGSSNVVPSYAVTPLAGIRDAAGAGVEVVSSEDASAAEAADVVIVVAALSQQDEGEAINGGGDRDTLDLSRDQEDLIIRAGELGDRVVVVLEAGSAITMERWKDRADAVVMAWYPGMEGGRALAELLFGDENFSGRLVQTWPVKLEDEPLFGNHQDETEYEYFHGYRHFDHQGITPLFPFGFGLSYTTFELSNLQIPCRTLTPRAVLHATVEVENTGSRAGAEVVQAYVGFPEGPDERPLKELKGFARVELEPGEKKTVELEIRVSDLARFDVKTHSWVVDPGEYSLQVGRNAEDLPLVGTFQTGPEGAARTER